MLMFPYSCNRTEGLPKTVRKPCPIFYGKSDRPTCMDSARFQCHPNPSTMKHICSTGNGIKDYSELFIEFRPRDGQNNEAEAPQAQRYFINEGMPHAVFLRQNPCQGHECFKGAETRDQDIRPEIPCRHQKHKRHPYHISPPQKRPSLNHSEHCRNNQGETRHRKCQPVSGQVMLDRSSRDSAVLRLLRGGFSRSAGQGIHGCLHAAAAACVVRTDVDHDFSQVFMNHTLITPSGSAGGTQPFGKLARMAGTCCDAGIGFRRRLFGGFIFH